MFNSKRLTIIISVLSFMTAAKLVAGDSNSPSEALAEGKAATSSSHDFKKASTGENILYNIKSLEQEFKNWQLAVMNAHWEKLIKSLPTPAAYEASSKLQQTLIPSYFQYFGNLTGAPPGMGSTVKRSNPNLGGDLFRDTISWVQTAEDSIKRLETSGFSFGDELKKQFQHLKSALYKATGFDTNK